MNQRTLYMENCVITVDHEQQYVETRFEDQTIAPARPQDNDNYRANTERFGYTDTWQQCVEHEILHTWVAELMGKPHSVILWNVAHGGKKTWPVGGMEEEGYVTSVQRWLNTDELDDLVQTFLNEAERLYGYTRDETRRLTWAIVGRRM